MENGFTVLGWDAGWTPTGSAAWSVVHRRDNRWVCGLLENTPTGEHEVNHRLQELLEKWKPDVVTVDMPISKRMIDGYRASDRATTRAFSRYGCPVHSPTPERPGPWGAWITNKLLEEGYHVETKKVEGRGCLIEVYPHTAAVYLLRASYRIPYKIQRAASYYPGVESCLRKRKVLDQLSRLIEALAMRIELPSEVLQVDEAMKTKEIKAVEDRVDALLCAWAGIQAGLERFVAYGDDDSAIWNPDLKELDPANLVR